IDNDGLPDLLLTEYGKTRLFHNRGGGRFEEITRSAGIDNTRWATAAAFLDYDRDGWLDLVVVNYLDYSPTIKCYDTRGAVEFCGPQGMQGPATRLFHNVSGRGRSGSLSPSREEGKGEGSVQVRFEDVT